VEAAFPPFQRFCDTKKKIRREIEVSGIPYSFISANSFMAYFVDYFLHPHQKPEPEEVVIYGDGLTKGMSICVDLATNRICRPFVLKKNAERMHIKGISYA